MILVDCDFHPRYQPIASVDTKTGASRWRVRNVLAKQAGRWQAVAQHPTMIAAMTDLLVTT